MAAYMHISAFRYDSFRQFCYSCVRRVLLIIISTHIVISRLLALSYSFVGNVSNYFFWQQMESIWNNPFQRYHQT